MAASALRDGSTWKRTAPRPTEIHSHAYPDPSPSRNARTRQLVSSAWRSDAPFWCARIAAPTGSNNGAKRCTLSASVPGETGSPWSDSHPQTRCRGRRHA